MSDLFLGFRILGNQLALCLFPTLGGERVFFGSSVVLDIPVKKEVLGCHQLGFSFSCLLKKCLNPWPMGSRY